MKEPAMTTGDKQRAAGSWPRPIKLTIVAAMVAGLGLGLQLAGPHLAANAEPQLASGQANTQDAAIRRLHARIDAAWNRGDATGVAANWTTEGVTISPFGARFTGRADIASDIAEASRCRH
jgi:disulfide bond formation protein DsbB